MDVMVSPDSEIIATPDEVSPLEERTITCEEGDTTARAGGSDSGVELGAGAPGGCDGYASGFESLMGGAASTSCESSLMSFSGDLENVISGLDDSTTRAASGSSSSSRGRRTATPNTPGSRQSPSLPHPPARGAQAATASSSRRSEHKSATPSTKTVPRVPRRTEARSASRGRTPTVSTDDGRWPSVATKPVVTIKPAVRRSTGSSGTTGERRTPRAATTPPEPRCSTLDKYGTLPRRTRITLTVAPTAPTTETIKESPAKLVSREPSLNRAASLRRQRATATTSGSSSGYRSDAEDASGSSLRSKSLTRSLPPYPRKRRSHNMRDAAAQTCSDPPSREELEAQLERLKADHARAQAAVAQAEGALQTERSQREALQLEADQTARRVATMLKEDGAELVPRTDWLSDVEARLHATSDVAARHQKDLQKAQRLNRSLSEEVERARSAATTARLQLADAEEEAAELQDFLAAEKSMLAESLREAEDKVASLMKQLEKKEKDIERQQEECRHLVRLSEQRRQEAVALQAQVSSTERLLVSQGGCTTAASVALAGLCSRLESLLPQLGSPKEEVEIFLNEAYAPSVEASPESRRRSAATSPASTPAAPAGDEDELSKVKSPAGLHAVEDAEDEEGGPQRLAGSESLHDLTQAILSCHTSLEQPHQAQPKDDALNSALADQASELDLLVSKLLATFQSLLLQREQCIAELNLCRQKLDSEHRALTEANSQLEAQGRHVRQLEAAQRIAQQQSSDETPALREALADRERQLAEMSTKAAAGRQLLVTNWRQAAEELRRQYEAIDKALEVLHSEQDLVRQSPGLSQLQRELEETNFRCVSLPSPTPDDLAQQLGAADVMVSLPLAAIHMPEAVNGTA